MPTARQTDWRIIAGTLTSAALVASTVVENFPLQTDQDFSQPWEINSFKSTVISIQRGWVAGDLSKHADGFIRCMWHFDYMTNLMLKYWVNQFLPGVSFVSGNQSAPVTIKTFDKYDNVFYLNAQMYTPGGTPQVGGWQDVEWAFEGGAQTS